MNTVWIYGLCESGSDTVRYVGKTKLEPAVRLAQHVSNAKSERPRCPRVAAWLRELEIMGIAPRIVVLEQSDDGSWAGQERYWIAKLASSQLLNISDGGDAGHAASHSAISKMRMREAYFENPARREHILRLNAAKRGTKKPFRARPKMVGMKRSEATRVKMSQSARKWYEDNPDAAKKKARDISAAHKKSAKIAEHIETLRILNAGSSRPGISAAAKQRLADPRNHPFFGKKHSPESIAKNRASNIATRARRLQAQVGHPTLF